MAALRSVDATEGAREFERVCGVDDVANLTLRGAVLQDGTRVCVGNRDGAFFAMIDRCPHQQFPLSDGELLADGSVVCARHGAAYCSTTGLSIRGPKGETPCGRMTLCQVRVVDGDIFVRAPMPRF
jgi:nitrite reductase/ring-hydroxylating ferredoxin subunit